MLITLLAILPSRAAETTVFPGADWAEATPESQGVDSAKLKEAAELLARTAGADGARELVVIRHGRMIYKGDDIDKRHGVWSATKSFTSTVLGLLIADGKCTLDTRVADVLPELKAHYPDVTLRHFTTMTSGYRAVGDETTGSYRDRSRSDTSRSAFGLIDDAEADVKDPLAGEIAQAKTGSAPLRSIEPGPAADHLSPLARGVLAPVA
jgi:CubicO group peptidase (beta-lactamase class C family)